MSLKEKLGLIEKTQEETPKSIDRIYFTEINYNKVDETVQTGAKFATGDINTNILIFQLSLYENFIDLTDSRIRVYANILKPDNKRVVMDCVIVEANQGVVSIELPQQAVLVEGEHFVEIVVQKADMEKLISPRASYRTYASIEGKYELEESECVYPIISQILDDIDLLKNNKIDRVELVGQSLKFYAGDLEKFNIALPSSGEGGAISIVDEEISTTTTWSSKKVNDTKANKTDLDTHTKNNKIHLTEGAQTIKGNKSFENAIHFNNPSAMIINGGQVEMITPKVETGWARGFTLRQELGQPSIAGFGFYGTGEEINSAYIGIGTDAWSKSKNLTIGSDEITFKGKKLATVDMLIWDNILNKPELLKGDKGDKGDTGSAGATPNIAIGNVTTLEPNQPATVTKRGTTENPIFDFGIPKGQNGADGTGEAGGCDNIVNFTVSGLRVIKVTNFDISTGIFTGENVPSTSMAVGIRLFVNEITVLPKELALHNGSFKLEPISENEFKILIDNKELTYEASQVVDVTKFVFEETVFGIDIKSIDSFVDGTYHVHLSALRTRSGQSSCKFYSANDEYWINSGAIFDGKPILYLEAEGILTIRDSHVAIHWRTWVKHNNTSGTNASWFLGTATSVRDFSYFPSKIENIRIGGAYLNGTRFTVRRLA